MSGFFWYEIEKCPSFVWEFNEIVHYSIYAPQDYSEQWQRTEGRPHVAVQDCNELRRLVIRYGGEQKNA